jgi:murein DD-endopeptidase MepM/ murein hydrolase activator NlpD
VVEGNWSGVLAGKLHIVVSIQRSPTGYRGVLDSVTQGVSFPLDEVIVDGTAVRFGIPKVGGSYEGRADAAKSEIAGTWTQNGHAQPLDFARSDARAAEPKPAPAVRPLDAPLDVAIPSPPVPARMGEQVQLVYELHVTNWSRREVSLQQIDVDARGARLARLEGVDLAELCGRPGAPDAHGLDRLKIGPGLRAVVYLFLPAPASGVPAAIDHRITVRIEGDPEPITLANVRVPVREGAPLVIAPPLRGRWWQAANGPSKGSPHRKALIPVGGHARISQRFAIDWVKLGDDGKTHRGDSSKNASYFAYGSEALAVANGVVTEVKDGIPENVPGGEPAVPVTLETIGGNHVIVDLGAGRFAFWAHLQPGSVRVKVGEHVKRAQVLGLVGNSGNSSEPHLHFHVSDASSPLGSEGLPYAFDAFDVRKPDNSAAARAKDLPAENEIVGFP